MFATLFWVCLLKFIYCYVCKSWENFVRRKKFIGASLLLFYFNMTANCFIQCPLDPCYLSLEEELLHMACIHLMFSFCPNLLSICFHKLLIRRNCISLQLVWKRMSIFGWKAHHVHLCSLCTLFCIAFSFVCRRSMIESNNF